MNSRNPVPLYRPIVADSLRTNMKSPMIRLCQRMFAPHLFTLAGALVGWPGLDARAEDWPQWRGPNRDGLSPDTGLLQEWPKDGPKLVWEAKGAGRG